jgi:DNA polymerase alpha subunit B
MRQAKHWQMKRTPDILFLPSKLSFMVKEIHGSLVINPGFLVKGASGGTYAKLTINPLPEQTLRHQQSEISDEPMLHDVHSRTRVDIFKI